MVWLKIQNPNKEAPSLLFLSHSIVYTIGGTINGNNTDDVGLAAPKVGVDSPKRVRYYFRS
jgi:hypothetical protein